MSNINEHDKVALNAIKSFVFDMASTTVDEDKLVYKVMREAIKEQGFNVI